MSAGAKFEGGRVFKRLKAEPEKNFSWTQCKWVRKLDVGEDAMKSVQKRSRWVQ